MGHLITLLKKEDLIFIKDSVTSDHLNMQMKRVWEKLLPEKTSVLCEARSHITNLKNNSEFSSEEKSILNCLNDILTQDF